MHLDINGKSVEFDGDPSMPLLWFVREHLGLTGTKFGCGIGACGACTLHVNGTAVRSCSVSMSEMADKTVLTIEGLSKNRSHPVQKAWIDVDVPQCGYCQSGMIMAVSALLNKNPAPNDSEIDASITNLCRCATYHRIRAAIHVAAKQANPIEIPGE
jgi:isoquinoline 1-oxidoreductase alpha subunit